MNKRNLQFNKLENALPPFAQMLSKADLERVKKTLREYAEILMEISDDATNGNVKNEFECRN